MGEIRARLKAAIAQAQRTWHSRNMLSALRQRCQDYARIARPMLIYGLGIGLWLADLAVVGQRFWPRVTQIFAGAPIGNTPICHNPQCDFSMFWPSGVVARAHDFATLYKPLALLAARQHLLFAGASRIEYIYPPPTLLLTMPISYLPFGAAFLIWSAVLTLASILCLRWGRLSWPVIACTLLCPAALWNYECGQLSLFAACLLAAGLLRMGNAPWLAGILFGALIIKPQLGLLAGVALLATGNWRAVGAATATAFGLSALITVLLGPSVWHAYFLYGSPVAKQILNAKLAPHSYETFGISVFWMLRSLGAGLTLSGAVQATATVIAIALTWRAWRSDAGLIQKFAITAWASLLATPYGYTNDMVAACTALAAMVERRSWRMGFAEPFIWLWPALSPIIANACYLELTPCIIALALAWSWRAAPRQPAAQGLVIPA
jgi:alpha-1,2-mannosyltransferase